jgi:polar amino acid transport system substrate-binding protein
VTACVWTRRSRARLIALACGIALIACDLPRDPNGTLEGARGGVIRAGAVENPPWVVVDGATVGGLEAELVRAIAECLDARVEWVRGTESELLAKLERGHLDLVAGGLTDASPWRARVAFAGPYRTTPGEHEPERHVLALPPGENGWLVFVERFLHERKPGVRSVSGGIEARGGP